MVDIAPFRALRFDSSKSKGNISKFICPPYDVISPAEREGLVRRSNVNVVQLELPEGEGPARYFNASKILDRWKKSGVLVGDPEPVYYLIETTFRIKDAFAPAKTLKRYGVLTALAIEPPGKGKVRPHEKTLPKAKEDRLNLLTAVRTQVSPIFGLFFDPKKSWARWIKKIVRRPAIAKGREKTNLEHRLWRVEDAVLQRELRALLKSKELYIADGHHRYEVSWAYKEERLRQEPAAGLRAGFRRVMAYVCPMEESGLVMLPTHRLVRSTKTFEVWRNHLERFFSISPVKNLDAMVKTLSRPSSGGKKSHRLIGWLTSRGSFLLKLRADISLNQYLQLRPDVLKELDVVLLHDLALGEALQPPFLADKELIYTRDLGEMKNRIKADPAWVGFLLASSGVGSLARVAQAGEVMPPKTTYFYPKVPTGFTLMPLDQEIA